MPLTAFSNRENCDSHFTPKFTITNRNISSGLLQFQPVSVAVTIHTPLESFQHFRAMRRSFMAILAGWNVAMLVSVAQHALQKSMSFVTARQYIAHIAMTSRADMIRDVLRVAYLQR